MARPRITLHVTPAGKHVPQKRLGKYGAADRRAQITARAAGERLRKSLPEGVRMGATGSADSILLQGRGPRVHDVVEMLKKFDVRREPGQPESDKPADK